MGIGPKKPYRSSSSHVPGRWSSNILAVVLLLQLSSVVPYLFTIQKLNNLPWFNLHCTQY